jgi:hypothetical protein
MGSSSTGTGNLTLNIPLNQKDLPFQNLFSLGANTSYNKIFYTISDGTNWEIGVGTFAAYSNGTTIFGSVSSPILSREEVLESTNNNSFVNFNRRTNVSLTLPANVTVGSAATADNSSVGTDLIAWNNVQNELRKRIVRGTLFNNGGVGGIVSTYSLVYTTTFAYWGGVLAPNGDIHFVPYQAAVGQKISAAGVVSTYSLIIPFAAYYGGVLAPNGDIHFVPGGGTPRGQKVSASGVVSTYSLVYTTVSGAYSGGVLAPNGDIHFVPGGAVVGQKISATGVVSTYSLVYTAGAYDGGVLAPNGDIHFVPSNANRGQKISAAGVVSTYSLVYTVGDAYRGGVLAPNGDIHFVPYLANRGQKVNGFTGVVSTYSLVHTVAFGGGVGAYIGGVLAPNGDIHFVPYYALVGQKISAAGVVSTYSLVYTVGDAYRGGVLAPNGDIHFVPFRADVVQKISTNINTPIGHCVSPFFNKF